jgi:lipopolysaccharide transport system ATP-binding protein
MTRIEIRRKFDEIVAFAEVETFLDTPVKRYSSGMYVRLAFAVAAHLEPEILIVDEVLAVGDAEFQKKCLGKMGQVAGEGRTVLFVSHNTTAVRALCKKSLLLERGRLAASGPTEDMLGHYLRQSTARAGDDGDLGAFRRRGAGNVRFRRIGLRDRNGNDTDQAATGEDLGLVVEFAGSKREPRAARLGINFFDAWGTPLFICANEASHGGPLQVGAGDTVVCRIPRLPLGPGHYKVTLFLERNGIVEDWLDDQISIEVGEGSFFGTTRNLPAGWAGKTVLVDHSWRVEARADDTAAAPAEESLA